MQLFAEDGAAGPVTGIPSLITVRRSRWLRRAWPVVTGLAVTANVLVLRQFTRSLLNPAIRAELPDWHLSPAGYVAVMTAITGVFMLICLAVAAVIFFRAAREPVALFCAYMLVALGCGLGGFLPGLPITNPVVNAVSVLLTGAAQVLVGWFFLVFPSGRFVPRWTRWCVLAAAGGVAVVVVPSIAHVRPVPAAVQPIGVGLVLLGVGAQVYRYRRASAPAERQQTKWVVFGVAAAMAVFAGSRLVALLLTPAVRQSQVAASLLGGSTVILALAIIPVCIGIAVLRAGLWDVDLVINRALLYAGLTVGVIGIYVLVVWYLGTLLHTGARLWTPLVATGVVAVVLQPLRARLQRGVNRLTYGQRDEPYAVIAELGRRLEASAQTQSVLTAAVETLAKALRLPYAAIMLGETGSSPVPVAAYGTPAPSPLAMPLRYGPDPLGQLLLGPRRPGEPFTPADMRLLEDLARQISTAARAVTLAADLQHSRERLVTAREEERRRLRRDLHDGLGPALAGLALKASSISELVPADPAAASRVADEVYAEIRAAIAGIRRLVYGLRPPTLDELGLLGAIREVGRPAAQDRLELTVSADGDLTGLPAAVEVAAYRIAAEALINVHRHARACSCTVRLRRTEALELEITDDGTGIQPDHPSGVGLLAMHERAAELGGTFQIDSRPGRGTRLTARLPLTPQGSADGAPARTDS